VVVDDVSADNADHDVVDRLTSGIVKEFDRVVEGGFNVVIIVEVEELRALNAVVTHGVVEEDDVELEATDVVEVVEVAGDGIIITTIVVAVDIRDDSGVRVVVESVEIADGGDVVKIAEEALAGDVEHTEDVVGDDIVDVVADEGVVAIGDGEDTDIVERKPRDVVDISNPVDEVELGDVKLVLDVVVVANAIVEREDNGVDVASAIAA
jgi:hypothetical protein